MKRFIVWVGTQQKKIIEAEHVSIKKSYLHFWIAGAVVAILNRDQWYGVIEEEREKTMVDIFDQKT